jgi:creatinine amidohydrolase
MGFGAPEGLLSAREREFGIHGGEAETSLMLHFRPELVDMSRAEDFASSAEAMQGGLRPTGGIAYGWIARDLNRAGVVGDAAAATAQKGAAIAAHQAEGFLALLAEVAALDLDTFAAFSDPSPGG